MFRLLVKFKKGVSKITCRTFSSLLENKALLAHTNLYTLGVFTNLIVIIQQLGKFRNSTGCKISIILQATKKSSITELETNCTEIYCSTERRNANDLLSLLLYLPDNLWGWQQLVWAWAMAQQVVVQQWRRWNQTVLKGYELLPQVFLGTWLDEYVDCMERSKNSQTMNWIYLKWKQSRQK